MRRLTILALGAVLLSDPAGAAPSGGGGPEWCASSPRGARDAYWAHREQAERRGTVRARSDTSAVTRVGDVAVLLDEGDLALLRHPVDLQGLSLRFTPEGAGYSVARMALPLLPAAGTALRLGDDDSTAVALPFGFPFYGRAFSGLHVNSDGNVTFEQPDGSSLERSLGRMLAGPPRIAPLFGDFDPSAGGSVRLNPAADHAVITWENVPEFGERDTNTFQVVLWADGRIDFTYAANVTRTLDQGAAGVAPGGEQRGLTPVDFSALTVAAGDGALGESFRESDTIDTLATARKLYQAFPDDYQQIVVYTTRRLVERGTFAFEQTVRNDIAGIGAQAFDQSAAYGSRGRLESLVMMDDISKYPDDLERPFLGGDSVLSVLGHEVGHRWLAQAVFQDGAQPSRELLGRSDVHWSFFMDTDGSHDEGNEIVDQGGGRFLTQAPSVRYGPLDQYLMGLRPADEVPPFFFVRSPTGTGDVDPGREPQGNVSFTGLRKDVTVQDVVAATGPRVPAFPDAPRSFRQAFVLVAVGGPPTAAEVEKVERIRQAWPGYYARSTEGRGQVDPRLQ